MPATGQLARRARSYRSITWKVSRIEDARINHHAGLHRKVNGQLRFSALILARVSRFSASWLSRAGGFILAGQSGGSLFQRQGG